MKRWKKIFLLLETFLIVCLFTGCFDYREIEKNTIVAGVAIDEGTGGYKYHLTFETLSMSGGKEQSMKSVLLESDGNTLFDAVRNAVKGTDKKLYFSDCKLIVISKELAMDGVEPLIEFLLRDHEPRITLLMAVSDEDTAAQALNVKLGSGEPVSFHTADAIAQSEKTMGHILPVPLYQIYNILSNKSEEITLPDVRVVKGIGGTNLVTNTNVIFRNNQMVGYMKQDECLYYLMLKNKVSGGVLLTGINTTKKDIALEILKSKATIKPVINGNSITMKINIQVDANIAEENDRTEAYTVGNGEFRLTEQAASQTVKIGTENLIADIQKNYDADIFGFGAILNQNCYDDWEKVVQKWDTIFPQVKCEVTADVKIITSATVLPKGGE